MEIPQFRHQTCVDQLRPFSAAISHVEGIQRAAMSAKNDRMSGTRSVKWVREFLGTP